MPQTNVTVSFNVAFPGAEPDNSFSADNYVSRVSTETALQLPFGTVVAADSATPGVGCKALAAQADIPLGILPQSDSYQKGFELGVTADANGNIGLLPGTNAMIKRRGRLWVQIDEDITNEGSAVKYRKNAVGSGVGPGCFRKTASAGNTVDISKFARWCGAYTAANGYGLLEFDFTMQGSKTSD